MLRGTRRESGAPGRGLLQRTTVAISIILLADFRNYFDGNKEAYGVHTYGEGGEGKNYTKVAPVTEALYARHLNGEGGLGIVPIDGRNDVSFSVIDVDIYEEKEVTRYVELVYRYDMPVLPFRSKSGGLHLYMFFKDKMKAKKAKDYMGYIRILLGLRKSVEVFPKQDRLVTGQVGNWINLPYYGGDKTRQYLFSEESKPLLLEEALIRVRDKLQTEESLMEFFDNLPLSDAPPCLQSIYMTGETSYRNEYLFSLARYYKTKYGDDFEFKIAEANNALRKPIDIDRLNRTIISSHKKKEYSYKCLNEPISSLCEKAVCRARRFGIGGEEVSELSYEDFIQYDTDPPYYEWVINGKSLKFYSEESIIMQRQFRNLCFRVLHILPARLKETNWTHIVNTALRNMVTKGISDGEDISPGAMFKEYLVEFLEKRAMARTREQILVDRVYKDDELGSYVFKAKNLVVFLINQKQFRAYGQTEIQDRLRRLNGEPRRYYIGKEKGTVRAWTLPYGSLRKFLEEPMHERVEVEFKEEYGGEPF